MQTEDHPLEYGSFEGRIPDGEYGAGDSLIWDRGVYDTVPPGQASAQRKKGHLHLVFSGEKMQGGWHLVRTRGPSGTKSNWILFKAKDELADKKRDVVAEAPGSVVCGAREHARAGEPRPASACTLRRRSCSSACSRRCWRRSPKSRRPTTPPGSTSSSTTAIAPSPRCRAGAWPCGRAIGSI